MKLVDPSGILRVRDDAERETAMEQFVGHLSQAAAWLKGGQDG